MAKCLFSGLDARVVSLNGYDGYSVATEAFGEYWITGDASASYPEGKDLSDLCKLNCLKETVNLNRERLIPFFCIAKKRDTLPNNPKVVLRSIEEMKERQIDHKEKDNKILDLLSKKLSGSINPFKFVHLTQADRYSIGIFDDDEYTERIAYLAHKHLIALSDEGTAYLKNSHHRDNLAKLIAQYDVIKLTVQGWGYVQALSSSFTSRDVFIAMAFTNREGARVSAELRDTIKQTLEKLNWKPLIVDEVEHNEGIMDKVIACINDARFVIAELTHQKSGVYYEAGFAKGKGLPVIHVVKKSDFDECHFDVKHLNLIVWESLEQLSGKLENRIKATII